MLHFVAHHERSGSRRRQRHREGNIYHQAVLALRSEISEDSGVGVLITIPSCLLRSNCDGESIVALS